MMRLSFPLAAALLLAVSIVPSCEKLDPDPDPDPEEVKTGTIQRISLSATGLNRTLSTTVWLPAGYDENKTYPVLYLLHGYGDDNNSWNRKGYASSIADNYIQAKGVPMIIAMPDALTTFYVGDFETYFHEVLVPEVETRFHGNGKRALAGLSMGGYGTLYYALKYPEKFTYAYAMSPASDEAGFRVLASMHEASFYPPITVESGTDDLVVGIAGVRSLVEMLRESGLKCEFIERSGDHGWGFWQACLEKALVVIGESFK
ncbi:MAG: hypothetical protein IKX62_01740 [Bacteroidales bacterium]|nr:hypothetical protein [Bacteroidales bacterium]